jgi:DNA polymerase
MPVKSPKVTAADFLPRRRDLASLRKAAANCEGCELYQCATQTVFGAGNPQASMVLVGEMPGDQEDVQGLPFVGPAGRVLDEILEESGIDRSDTYVTNAVKHFRFEPRGKRRLHKKPGVRHIEACKPWLAAEILAIQPKLIVCLGATAAQALLGKQFRITRERGRPVQNEDGVWLMATWHPSAVLRAPDKQKRDQMRREAIGDLRRAAQASGAAGVVSSRKSPT